MEERVNVSSELEKPKLYSITFIKQCLQWLKSVWLFPAAADLITCSTLHKTTSAATANTGTFHPVKNGWQTPLTRALKQVTPVVA